MNNVLNVQGAALRSKEATAADKNGVLHPAVLGVDVLVQSDSHAIDNVGFLKRSRVGLAMQTSTNSLAKTNLAIVPDGEALVTINIAKDLAVQAKVGSSGSDIVAASNDSTVKRKCRVQCGDLTSLDVNNVLIMLAIGIEQLN